MFAWKAERFAITFLRLLLCHIFSEILGDSEEKKVFTERQTSDTNHLLTAVKEKFSGLFFFWTILSENEFPRD